MGVEPRNLLRLSALLKVGQAVLLLIIICIAEVGSSYPGFGKARSANLAIPTPTPTPTPTPETVHYMESKHRYFFGAGICTCYFIYCLMMLVCYLLDDMKTQTSKYEMGMSILGSIFFLSLAMSIFVDSKDGEDDTAKLITEGCCCVGVAVMQIFDAIYIHLRIKKGDD